MAGTVGNRAQIAREPVVTELGVRPVPFLSGNALRSSMLRRPGFVWLAEACGLDHGLTKPELYFLLAGGCAYEGGGRESTQLVCELKDVCPLAGALGGTLPRQILSGSVCVDSGVLVCAENRDRLDTFLPDGVIAADLELRPADSFVGEWQYTRRGGEGELAEWADGETDLAERARRFEAWEGEKRRPESPEDTPLPGEERARDGRIKSRQMIYGGECVIAGAAFAHRITLHHPRPPEVGALLWSLRLWRQQGNTMGGMSARGHGILETVVWLDPEPDGNPAAEYVDHVTRHQDRLADWLRRQFRPDAAREAAGKGKRRGKAEEGPA